MNWRDSFLDHVDGEQLLTDPTFAGATVDAVIVLVKSLDAEANYAWSWRRSKALSIQEHLGVLVTHVDRLRDQVVDDWRSDEVLPMGADPEAELGVLLTHAAQLRHLLGEDWEPGEPLDSSG